MFHCKIWKYILWKSLSRHSLKKIPIGIHWRLNEKRCMQNFSIKPKWSLHSDVRGIINKRSLKAWIDVEISLDRLHSTNKMDKSLLFCFNLTAVLDYAWSFCLKKNGKCLDGKCVTLLSLVTLALSVSAQKNEKKYFSSYSMWKKFKVVPAAIPWSTKAKEHIFVTYR